MNQSKDLDPIAAARANYPALEQWTYLDVAARCVLSRGPRAAIDAYLDDHQSNGGDKKGWFELIEKTRARFAQLINADADEVSFTKNISDGINMIATGFHWKRGENVILCPALEHP